MNGVGARSYSMPVTRSARFVLLGGRLATRGRAMTSSRRGRFGSRFGDVQAFVGRVPRREAHPSGAEPVLAHSRAGEGHRRRRCDLRGPRARSDRGDERGIPLASRGQVPATPGARERADGAARRALWLLCSALNTGVRAERQRRPKPRETDPFRSVAEIRGSFSMITDT